MFKKLLILMLLLPVVAFSQFKIGSVSLKDSSGVLVFSSPLKTNTTDQWISRTWLPSLVVSTNSGLKWDATTGLTLKLGSGLILQNDTLKYNGSSIVAVDDSTIQYVGQKLKVKYSEGLTSDIYGVKLNLSTNSGLTYDGLGKLIINSDSGVSITGNKLKVKLDATNLEFDGLGSLKIKDNSITEDQISPNIDLPSLTIDGVSLNASDGKIASDSTVSELIYATKILFPETANSSTYDLEIVTDVNGNPTFSTSVGDYFIFRKPIQIDTGNLTLSNGRLLEAKGTYIDSSVTLRAIILGAGNYFVIESPTDSLSYISVTGWQAGAKVTLQFVDDCYIESGAGTSPPYGGFYLKSGNDWAPSNEDLLVLIFDGKVWRELSRQDN